MTNSKGGICFTNSILTIFSKNNVISTTLLLGNLLYSYFHEISSFFHTVLQISDLFLALFSTSNKRCPADDWQQSVVPTNIRIGYSLFRRESTYLFY